MNINICMKSAGKRRPVLDRVPCSIPDTVKTARELIAAIVQVEVNKYNEKGTDVQIVPFLTQKELENQAAMGKVGFGRIYSEKKADVDAAVENALQCYEDGLIRIFQNEEEVTELDVPLRIKEQDNFTFLRLVFLAGSMW